ncbi:MAG: bifunctional oligoribonuclease/PAP phosphatase NrnA [Oscillospiraceae bacterium]
MTIRDCAAFLRERDGFLLLTHSRPDGDTLCSASALCSALRRLGKTAALYPNPEITERYKDMTAPYMGESGTEGACVVSVDTAGVRMLPLGFSGRVELAIDHHASNEFYAEQSLVMGKKAACGEIVLELIEELCGSVTKEEADLLYAAVSTDTGCFCYANTNADTLRAAARLLDLGAENGRLNKLLFRSFSYARLRLEGMVYAGLRSYRDHQINIAVVTLDMMERSGATENDCDDLASLAGKVQGSVVAITVRELEKGRCKVSVRTNELVNASAVCALFGGGGHSMAAGCTLDAGPEETAEKMLAAVEEIWK